MILSKYKKENIDKIQSYLDLGFTEKQIDEPLSDILCNLNTIIWVYKNHMPLGEWDDAADFVKAHMMEQSTHQEDPGNKEYLYRKVRGYIQKDKKRVNSFWRRMPLPPPEKMDEYADILSELALDCIDVCVKEFKEDAKVMQCVQPKLSDTPTQEIIERKKKHNSNFTLTFLKRLEQIKNVDDKWQAEYSPENEETNSGAAVSSRKRKHIANSDVEENPFKKRVTFAKTVTGGDTNGAQYRKAKREEIKKKEKIGNDGVTQAGEHTSKFV